MEDNREDEFTEQHSFRIMHEVFDGERCFTSIACSLEPTFEIGKNVPIPTTGKEKRILSGLFSNFICN